MNKIRKLQQTQLNLQIPELNSGVYIAELSGKSGETVRYKIPLIR